jgi:glucose-6-phosphate isomerase
MEKLVIDIENIYPFVEKERVEQIEPEVTQSLKTLYEKTGKGSEYLGWLDLPTRISDKEIRSIEETAHEFQKKTDIVVVVGIGGSYLGARAVIDALSHNFKALLPENKSPLVLYAGQNLGEDYLYELIEVLDNYDYRIVVISKSGTTTEPAIAFRILQKHLYDKYGKQEASTRIAAITDASRGALLDIAKKENYKTFVIPDDVGGRFSVFTPVGLLPVAIAGFDIHQMLRGAKHMQHLTSPRISFEENPALQYAAARNALYRSGKTTEILVNYTPRLHYITEWWKQLYGESEGKDGKGIFPAAVNFTTDLHSLGQYIQDGHRNLFETVLTVEKTRNTLAIPSNHDNSDGLNYIAYKPLNYINKMAGLGTMLAHIDGGVPNIMLELSNINENSIGQLLYFFEVACGISGYTLGVNPFDQPGVENYKTNMFALLGKPGYENLTAELHKRMEKFS